MMPRLVSALVLAALTGLQPMQRSVFQSLNQPAPSGGGGSHSFTIVQETTCSGTTSSTTCSLASGTAAGDALLLACWTTDTGVGTTQDPTFTPSATVLLSGQQSGGWAQLSYIYPVTAGTSSIAMTMVAYVAGGCVIAETAGTSYVVDATSSMTTDSSYTGSGSSTSLTGSVSTSNANDAILGYAYVEQTYPNLPAFTAGTGYTSIGNVDGLYQSLSAFVEFQKVSSTGSYNPGLTWSTGSYHAAFGTVAVKLN